MFQQQELIFDLAALALLDQVLLEFFRLSIGQQSKALQLAGDQSRLSGNSCRKLLI
jgi:hypothetical protein